MQSILTQFNYMPAFGCYGNGHLFIERLGKSSQFEQANLLIFLLLMLPLTLSVYAFWHTTRSSTTDHSSGGPFTTQYNSYSDRNSHLCSSLAGFGPVLRLPFMRYRDVKYPHWDPAYLMRGLFLVVACWCDWNPLDNGSLVISTLPLSALYELEGQEMQKTAFWDLGLQWTLSGSDFIRSELSLLFLDKGR